MSRLQWGTIGTRLYETGVDRGVLYVEGLGGVAWNGLTSISENPSGGEPRPYYIDGVKYLNISSAEEFEATINAFYAPEEFQLCEGVSSVQNGLLVTNQPKKSFDLCYRTRIGNDVDGSTHGYKLHLVYNALAGPSQRDHNTNGSEISPTAYSWEITTLPPSITGFRPTAHLVVDSTATPQRLRDAIEDILYGTDANGARMIGAQEVVDLYNNPPLMRTNLAQEPRAAGPIPPDYKFGWTARWFGSSTGTGTWAFVVANGDGPLGLSTYMRKTWTAAPANNASTGFQHASSKGATAPPVTPGKNYVVSAYLRPSVGGKYPRPSVEWYDSTGTIIGTTVSDETFGELPANTWTRVAKVWTAPANAATAFFCTDISDRAGDIDWAAGDTLDGSALLVEDTGLVDFYFDGDTPDRDGYFYSWDGTANSSTSSLRTWK